MDRQKIERQISEFCVDFGLGHEVALDKLKCNLWELLDQLLTSTTQILDVEGIEKQRGLNSCIADNRCHAKADDKLLDDIINGKYTISKPATVKPVGVDVDKWDRGRVSCWQEKSSIDTTASELDQLIKDLLSQLRAGATMKLEITKPVIQDLKDEVE